MLYVVPDKVRYFIVILVSEPWTTTLLRKADSLRHFTLKYSSVMYTKPDLANDHRGVADPRSTAPHGAPTI